MYGWTNSDHYRELQEKKEREEAARKKASDDEKAAEKKKFKKDVDSLMSKLGISKEAAERMLKI